MYFNGGFFNVVPVHPETVINDASLICKTVESETGTFVDYRFVRFVTIPQTIWLLLRIASLSVSHTHTSSAISKKRLDFHAS